MLFRKILLVLISSVFLMSAADASVVYQDTNSRLIDSKDLKGKWIIFNFWAEWCGPCAKEIPELNHFYKTNKDKNVELYGVYYDHIDKGDLKTIVQGVNIGFPVLVQDPTPEFGLGEVSILPTTFIVNPKGQVVKTIYGASSESNLIYVLHELQRNYSDK